MHLDSITQLLVSATRQYPNHLALEVDNHKLTYQQLLHLATSYAKTIQFAKAPADSQITCLLANRSVIAFAGIASALVSGRAYLPLHHKHPPQRIHRILQKAQSRVLIVDQSGLAALPDILAGAPDGMLVLAPDLDDLGVLSERFGMHRLLTRRDLIQPETFEIEVRSGSELAYVLFTSGSTGEPKGVQVSHANACALIRNLTERYQIATADRISLFADLTFDPSVADIFTAWCNGASLVVPSPGQLLNPTRFLNDSAISVFHGVPSNGLLAARLGALKPNKLPGLRVSMFGGEPFPERLASQWQEAAPNSAIDNVYGPAECAVDVTAYRWRSDSSIAECSAGIVPIGYPLPGVEVAILDSTGNECPPGSTGELYIGGQQVGLGYLSDPVRTQAAFIPLAGRSGIYYSTGDLVSRSRVDGPLLFHGRRDHQIKVMGVRIELGDIECALREVTGILEVAAVGWPPTETGFAGIVAFVGNPTISVDSVTQSLRQRLPSQFQPRAVHVLPTLPLNTSGKVDRSKLLQWLEDQRQTKESATPPSR